MTDNDIVMTSTNRIAVQFDGTVVLNFVGEYDPKCCCLNCVSLGLGVFEHVVVPSSKSLCINNKFNNKKLSWCWGGWLMALNQYSWRSRSSWLKWCPIASIDPSLTNMTLHVIFTFPDVNHPSNVTQRQSPWCTLICRGRWTFLPLG